MCVCVCHILCVCVSHHDVPPIGLYATPQTVCVWAVPCPYPCPCRVRVVHLLMCVLVYVCRAVSRKPTLVLLCVMTHDSITYHALLIHPCDMTRSYVWQDWFICVPRHSSMRETWLIHAYDTTHSHVWHKSFTCVTWIIPHGASVETCTYTQNMFWYTQNLFINSNRVYVHQLVLVASTKMKWCTY